ncbi:hypothetical protein EVAR_47757_1 [Eumeta japonica]|uniref:Uncharacterized protein n=1 Tax=Eumeta variegata TaxID=151549 RepID=A0A4C1VVP8_EUMVA|nr:hypothetical protein EVAR_47757_1 [Eumeta japonica]
MPKDPESVPKGPLHSPHTVGYAGAQGKITRARERLHIAPEWDGAWASRRERARRRHPIVALKTRTGARKSLAAVDARAGEHRDISDPFYPKFKITRA